jgi:hypothetical protein
MVKKPGREFGEALDWEECSDYIGGNGHKSYPRRTFCSDRSERADKSYYGTLRNPVQSVGDHSLHRENNDESFVIKHDRGRVAVIRSRYGQGCPEVQDAFPAASCERGLAANDILDAPSPPAPLPKGEGRHFKTRS